MSLINDALKRARQAQKASPPVAARDPTFKAVETPPAADLPVLVIIGAFVLLGMGILVVSFILIERSQSHTLATTLSEPGVISSASPAPVPHPAAAPVVAAAPAAAPAAQAVAAVAPPAKPALPKLQGILYSADRPSAVLDGETVFVGDRVGDFQVLAITRGSVTIGGAGQTHVLTLP